jgi:predicted polyphosphate/ATP-dependent NAD kinase
MILYLNGLASAQMVSIGNAPQSSVKLGFLVNPVAGMGGSVGLKGTDGAEVQAEAARRGASMTSPERAVASLRSLHDQGLELEIVTCGGDMGENELKAAKLRYEVVYSPRTPTSKDDTVTAVREFVRGNVTLVVFVGGDGTARDILEVVGDSIPMIGVPAGVKMHSAVFLNRPEDLGPVVSSFSRKHALKDAEVMDIDEDLFRSGVLRAKLYGVAKVPDDRAHVQSGKMSYASDSAEDEAAEVGHYIADTMEPGVTYILGPGSTTAAIGKAKGFEKTLLGVDVVKDGRVIGSDASESDILRLVCLGVRARIIVSPIGSQGFVFGRGNQQISPRVIEAVGAENVVIVATPTKLQDTRILRVDTGDPSTDRMLKGAIKVVTGYRRRRLISVR